VTEAICSATRAYLRALRASARVGFQAVGEFPNGWSQVRLAEQGVESMQQQRGVRGVLLQAQAERAEVGGLRAGEVALVQPLRKLQVMRSSASSTSSRKSPPSPGRCRSYQALAWSMSSRASGRT
jgi:hypothetical protein